MHHASRGAALRAARRAPLSLSWGRQLATLVVAARTLLSIISYSILSPPAYVPVRALLFTPSCGMLRAERCYRCCAASASAASASPSRLSRASAATATRARRARVTTAGPADVCGPHPQCGPVPVRIPVPLSAHCCARRVRVRSSRAGTRDAWNVERSSRSPPALSRASRIADE
jgi:hypothetical protein